MTKDITLQKIVAGVLMCNSKLDCRPANCSINYYKYSEHWFLKVCTCTTKNRV